MVPHYEENLVRLRRLFLQPGADPEHRAALVVPVRNALSLADALKAPAPRLGASVEPDYETAQRARLAFGGQPLDTVIAQLVAQLDGMYDWNHPQCQVNVNACPTIAGIVGALLASTYNPNLCSDESGRGFSEAEVAVTAMAAELVGYDPAAAGGVFTFGGTGSLLYGLKIGLEKAVPHAMREGLRGPVAVITSDQAHYAVQNAAGWLGIGESAVVRVPTDRDHSIRLDELRSAARRVLQEGRRLAAIVATLGSTDAFGLDDLAGIALLRDELVAEFDLSYRPHIHADAVIGWAWSVFNDYDFGANPLGFRERTVRALKAARQRVRHLPFADSLGIDFHKTGYAPSVSSLLLVRDARDLQMLGRDRDAMPYLYRSGTHHPGTYTLETSRAATGPTSALASLLLLGRDGYRTLVGHAVEMAEVLREALAARSDIAVLNAAGVGPATLFRIYPASVDPSTIRDRERCDPSFREQLEAHNRLNRRVAERVNAEAVAGRGVMLSATDCYRRTDYGAPIAALKSYVSSPFTDERHMRSVVGSIVAARDAISV